MTRDGEWAELAEALPRWTLEGRGHGHAPPLRVRGEERPPREAHFDACGPRTYVVLYEWYAIVTDTSRRAGKAVVWFSRSSTIALPSRLAEPTARAWAHAGVVCLWPADTKPATTAPQLPGLLS